MNRTIHQLDELGELKDLDEFAVYDTDSGYTKRYSADGLNIPVGTYFLYEGTTAPNDHYFICDGTDTTGTEKELAIVYPKLYAKLGNSNVLPDLRGRRPTNANYSTDEIKTGKTWIDGKPIYRKVFDNGSFANNLTIDISSLNIETLIKSEVLGSDNNNGLPPIWTMSAASGIADKCAFINTSYEFKTTGSYYKRYVILEYTKTTDSAETSTMNFIIRAD